MLLLLFRLIFGVGGLVKPPDAEIYRKQLQYNSGTMYNVTSVSKIDAENKAAVPFYTFGEKMFYVNYNFSVVKTHRFFSAREFGLALLGIHLFLGY